VPVVKGLPERPKSTDFTCSGEYMKALETYVDALENWIDVRAFQDGDDYEVHKRVHKSSAVPFNIERTASFIRIYNPAIKTFTIENISQKPLYIIYKNGKPIIARGTRKEKAMLLKPGGTAGIAYLGGRPG